MTQTVNNCFIANYKLSHYRQKPNKNSQFAIIIINSTTYKIIKIYLCSKAPRRCFLFDFNDFFSCCYSIYLKKQTK